MTIIVTADAGCFARHQHWWNDLVLGELHQAISAAVEGLALKVETAVDKGAQATVKIVGSWVAYFGERLTEVQNTIRAAIHEWLGDDLNVVFAQIEPPN